MNYCNYDIALVEKRRVKCFNWPPNIPMISPSDILVLEDLITLRESWRVGRTCWSKITKQEADDHMAEVKARQASGEVVGTKRKTRDDKGTTRGKRPVNKENDVADEGPARKKTKVAKPVKAKVAKPVRPRPKTIKTPAIVPSGSESDSDIAGQSSGSASSVSLSLPSC